MEIRLTESELTRLISRIIKETEEENTDFDIEGGSYEEDYGNEEDPVEVIAQFFEDEDINELSPRQINRIESKVDSILDSESMGGDIYEEDEMMGRRRPSFASRLMKRGGEGMAVTGFMGFIGNVMGWSEFEVTQKLHELTEQLQLSNYTGPITVAMIASGIALALAGRARQYRDMGEY